MVDFGATKHICEYVTIEVFLPHTKLWGDEEKIVDVGDSKS